MYLNVKCCVYTTVDLVVTMIIVHNVNAAHNA